MIETLFFLLLLAVLVIVGGSAIYGGVSAAPWVPTWQRDVKRILDLAGVRSGELVVDLGSGDGRFVITAARDYRARAVGYEISLLPYCVSRWRVWWNRLAGRATIRWQDFFRADLSSADVIVAFLTPHAMNKLHTKFVRELKPGCRIVSYAFALPGWTPLVKSKPHPRSTPVFLYRVDAPKTPR